MNVMDEEFFAVKIGKCYVKAANLTGPNITATTLRSRADEATRYRGDMEPASKLAEMIGGTVVKIRVQIFEESM